MTLATGLRSFWRADPWGTLAPPATPTGFFARAQNAEVNLYWDENVHATGFRIWRNGLLVYEGPHLTDDPVTGFPRPWTDTGLTNGTTYNYTIASYGPGGQSATAAASATPQAIITGLVASDVISQAATLTWNMATVAGFTPTAIDVRRDGQLIATLATTARTYTDWGAYFDGTEHQNRYSVIARDAAGVEYLDQIYVTIPEAVAPYFVGGTTVSTPGVTVGTWNLPTGIKKYDFIYVTVVRQATAGASATPSGYTAGYGSAIGTGTFYNQYWQQVTGTPPTQITLNFAASLPTSITISVWRGVEVQPNGAFSATWPPFTYFPPMLPTATNNFTNSSIAGMPLRAGPMGQMGTYVQADLFGSATAVNAAGLNYSTSSELTVNVPTHGQTIGVHSIHKSFSAVNVEEKGDVLVGFTTTPTGNGAMVPLWLPAPKSPRARTQAAFQGQYGTAGTSLATANGVNLRQTDGIMIFLQMSAVAGAASITSNNATLNTRAPVLVYDSGTATGPYRTLAWYWDCSHVTAAGITGVTFTATHPSAITRTLIVANHNDLSGATFDTGVQETGTNNNPTATATVAPNSMQWFLNTWNLGSVTTYPYFTPGTFDEWSLGTTGWGANALYSIGYTPSGATSNQTHTSMLSSAEPHNRGGVKTVSPTANLSAPWSAAIISMKTPGVLQAKLAAVVTAGFAAFGIPL